LVGETEVAHIGNDLVMVNQGAKMAYENYQSDALILLSIGGQRYGVRDSGISNG